MTKQADEEVSRTDLMVLALIRTLAETDKTFLARYKRHVAELTVDVSEGAAPASEEVTRLRATMDKLFKGGNNPSFREISAALRKTT